MSATAERIRVSVVPVFTWVPPTENKATFRYVDISAIDRDAKRVVGATELQVANAPSRARQLLRANDVLVSTVRPNLNAVAMVPEELDGSVGSTGFTVLRANPNRLLPRYLFHWVRTPAFVADMMKKATGASYPAVSDRIVLDSSIPLPSLAEQQRIAEILDKAEALRNKRKEASTLIEELLRSTFLDMFGDPVTNTRGWPVKPLGELADAASGVTKGKRYDDQTLVTLPYMRVANVQDGHLVLDDVKTITVSEEDGRCYRLKDGDVLLTEGGDPDKLGRGTVWRGEIERCIHQNHIFRARPGPQVRSEYLSAILGSERGKRYFLRAAKQTTGIATINMTQLKAFPVLLPPIDLQDAYLKFVGSATAARTTFQKQHKLADELFGSLVASAFSGKRGKPETAC
jgi:type I restriction enzyme S subunit